MSEAIKPRQRVSAASVVLGALVAAVTLAGAPPAIGGFASVEGSPGVGDPLFPEAGNGGYKVSSYDAKLRYRLSTNHIVSTTKIKAQVKTGGAALSRFDLDFRGPHVKYVKVDGKKAVFARSGQEMIVTPKAALADGAKFVVEVAYAGTPEPVTDPDNSQEGWVVTKGYSVALGEPQGTPAWLPSNDHPSDKARFKIQIEVPRGQKAIANGRLVEHKKIDKGRWELFKYSQQEPMATYLATVATGPLVFDKGRAGGVPYLAALSKGEAKNGGIKKLRTRTQDALSFERKALGPYPFSNSGGVVIPSSLGYSLETQTRPYYPGVPSQDLAVHENGHQWFGDSVSITGWNEIWLNEGFATYLEFLYAERNGGPTVHQTFDKLYAAHAADDDDFWNPPPGAPPTAADIFDGSIYVRGGMALEAVRLTVGDHDFFKILRDWASQNKHSNGTIAGFQQLAEEVSGQDLDTVFQNWLYDPGKPPPIGPRAAADGRGTGAGFVLGPRRSSN